MMTYRFKWRGFLFALTFLSLMAQFQSFAQTNPANVGSGSGQAIPITYPWSYCIDVSSSMVSCIDCCKNTHESYPDLPSSPDFKKNCHNQCQQKHPDQNDPGCFAAYNEQAAEAKAQRDHDRMSCTIYDSACHEAVEKAYQRAIGEAQNALQACLEETLSGDDCQAKYNSDQVNCILAHSNCLNYFTAPGQDPIYQCPNSPNTEPGTALCDFALGACLKDAEDQKDACEAR